MYGGHYGRTSSVRITVMSNRHFLKAKSKSRWLTAQLLKEEKHITVFFLHALAPSSHSSEGSKKKESFKSHAEDWDTAQVKVILSIFEHRNDRGWGVTACFPSQEDICKSLQLHSHTVQSAALLGPASTNKQSVSQERQRGLRGSLANLSLTSLERQRGRERERGGETGGKRGKLDLYLCF